MLTTPPASPRHARPRPPLFPSSAQTEFYCHPDPNRSAAYPASDRAHAGFSFLNSGTYVGRAGAIREAMDRFPNYTLADDDQRYWTTIYLASRADASLPRIALDHEADVFLCMNKYRADGDLDFDPAARRYRFRGGRAAPAVVHFNGEKRDLEPFFRALGGSGGGAGGGSRGGGENGAGAGAGAGAGTGNSTGVGGAAGGRVFWSPFELHSAALRAWLAAAALAALPFGVMAARGCCESGSEDEGVVEVEGDLWWLGEGESE